MEKGNNKLMYFTKPIEYNKLSNSSRRELLEQFQELYKDYNFKQINYVLMILNPSVDYNTKTGEFEIWVVWQNQFEEKLSTTDWMNTILEDEKEQI